MTRDQIEAIVRRKLAERLAALGSPSNGSAAPPEDVSNALTLVNKDAVDRARANGGRIAIAPGAIITPLAREHAEQSGVQLVQIEYTAPTTSDAAAPATSGVTGNPRQVAIASDHGGLVLKRELVAHMRALGYEVRDLGTHDEKAVDYPDMAHAVARSVVRGESGRGIVIDGAGIGSAITANKVPGIRAAHCHNLFEVRNSRDHNDANVLSLGGRVIGGELAKAMVTCWLETPFGGGRHARRVDKIRRVEEGYLRDA